MPGSLEEACELLTSEEGVVPLAGGTDLFVHWPVRLEAREWTYLDLSGVAELRGHRWDDGALVLGALSTYWDVVRDPRASEELPLLVAAARQVGAIQIQARGTWAGNVVNASPAADGTAVLMAYDAVLELVSKGGVEEVPLAEFYQGYKEMKLRPDQLIRSIRVPRRAYDVQAFEKVGPRRAQAITKVGVAAAHSEAGWRVVAVSMAPMTCRCPALEKVLTQGVRIGTPEDLLEALRQDVTPIDDIRSTAAYRERTMARVLYWALRERGVWPTPSAG